MTENIVLSSTFQRLTDETDHFLLTFSRADDGELVEIVISDESEDAPTLAYGHQVSPHVREGVSRAHVGPGFVWARLVNSAGTGVVAVVTRWDTDV